MAPATSRDNQAALRPFKGRSTIRFCSTTWLSVEVDVFTWVGAASTVTSVVDFASARDTFTVTLWSASSVTPRCMEVAKPADSTPISYRAGGRDGTT